MRLIDADRLKAEIMDWCVMTDDLFGMGKYHEREIVLQAIEESPTIDAVPVVRGKWKLYGNDDDSGMSYWCTACNFRLSEDLFYSGYKNGRWIENRVFKYCPNCGAKMLEEAEQYGETSEMAERKAKQINVRLTPALYNRFQTALHRTGHTVTDALIALITQYCDETECKSGGARPSA